MAGGGSGLEVASDVRTGVEAVPFQAWTYPMPYPKLYSGWKLGADLPIFFFKTFFLVSWT